jgi:hypothetical protein
MIMKKVILLIGCCLLSVNSFCQDQVTDKGYVYSSEGFSVKTATLNRTWSDGSTATTTCSGLYSADGKVFMHANSYADFGSNDSRSSFYV